MNAESSISPVNQSVLSEFSAEEVVDSVVLSGISGSTVTIVDTLVEGMPLHLQQNQEIQGIMGDIGYLERTYVAAFRDYYNSRLLANPERYILMATPLLCIVGVVFALIEVIGLLLFAAVIGLIVFYVIVRMRVARALKAMATDQRERLVTKMHELKVKQESLA